MCLRAPPQRQNLNVLTLLLATRLPAVVMVMTTMIITIMIIEQFLVAGFCVGSLNHTKPVQWSEKQAITAMLDAHLNLPHCREGQKDAKKGDYGQGSGTKSRMSRECCELVQSLDHSSKTSCLMECSLTSLRFDLPSDLLEQSLVAQAACLPTAMNSCSLSSSVSPLWGTTVSSGSMVATEQLSST